MTVGILTEKPSAARNFAKALGGQKGSYNGEQYEIAFARGHLYEFKPPADQVGVDLRNKYSSWSMANLPWDVKDLAFARRKAEGVSKLVSDLRSTLRACDEICIATDVDPSGEGGLIAWEIIEDLGLKTKKITRMNFTDEAPSSIQKAFKTRQVIPSMEGHDEYRKAWLRTRWDFLSMQWTRIATDIASQLAGGKFTLLRQGRLKSAMTVLVGDQLAAHKNWKRVPFFEPRFKDENSVVYTNPEADRKDKASDVDLSGLRASSVTVDSKTVKKSAPPRMLDLAALSALLSAKGVKASDVLGTYQRMYEDQVVSYPRTEDKHVTKEQFAELVKNAPQIARAIGVDPAQLTHTAPRSAHVKDSGAHGANRPGPNIPVSLDAVRQKYGSTGAMIYELLARSALAVLAEDYEYELQKGHVTDFPSFVGSVRVPKKQGWRTVLGEASMSDEEEEASVGLGTRAEPFVYEGAPSRPQAPTVKWLMTQLEKRDVGTGATRTSTFAEVSNAKGAHSLMSESRGKITLTEDGEKSYYLLPGTHIGDLAITEQVFSDMRSVAEGSKDADVVLNEVARLVVDDIAVMKANAEKMRKDFGLSGALVEKEYFEGTWAKSGEHVRFNRVWSGYRFTDEECVQLLNGEDVEVTATSARTGNEFTVTGALGEGEFNGSKTFGFQADFNKGSSGGNSVPRSMLGVKLTEEQREKLDAGEKVLVKGMKSKRTGKTFDAYLSMENKSDGSRGISFSFDK